MATVSYYIDGNTLDLDPKMEPTDPDYGYVTTYNLPLIFVNDKDETLGELMIYFKVIGYGLEGFDGGIETFFSIPYFSVDMDEMMDEVESFQYIFTHFGSDIQDLIDESLDILYDHYEEGKPLRSLDLEKI